MTQKERETIYRLQQYVMDVPGVHNAMDFVSHKLFYRDMMEVRGHVSTAMRALLDRDPDYREENARIVVAEIEALEQFLALRQRQDWKVPPSGEVTWTAT